MLREGGGQLSDDIPPPSADERAAADAEMATLAEEDGTLTIPGLELVPPPPAVGATIRQATKAKPAEPGENDRLRGLLREALTELEALRAMLPAG